MGKDKEGFLDTDLKRMRILSQNRTHAASIPLRLSGLSVRQPYPHVHQRTNQVPDLMGRNDNGRLLAEEPGEAGGAAGCAGDE